MTEKGSPPRVRGKVIQDSPDAGGWGITPACAGKSFWIEVTLCNIWDHPRVCGEKTKKIP